MSDGPSKNLDLLRHWKTYVKAVENNAFNLEEKCNLASNALLRDILNNDNQALLCDIEILCSKDQLDLDIRSLIEHQFHRHNKSPFANHLQRELMFRLKNGVAPDIPFQQAVKASVEAQINTIKNRIEDEFIRVSESGKIKQGQAHHIVTESNSIFDALDRQGLCEAVSAKNKHAFKRAIQKQKDIDQGPHL